MRQSIIIAITTLLLTTGCVGVYTDKPVPGWNRVTVFNLDTKDAWDQGYAHEAAQACGVPSDINVERFGKEDVRRY